MSFIDIRNVTVKYDEHVVLKNFNLQIEKGEFVTVIGTSGCGKSTALGLINGMVKPAAGEVFLEGKNLSEMDLIELRRRVGYVIQDVGLFPHMTVKENITFVPSLMGVNDDDHMQKRIDELVRMVALDANLLERYPRSLSGGQQQRIGIARAFMMTPDLILMDEPFGAVDEITRRHLQKELKTLVAAQHATVFFITHDIREALLLGTRVIVMDEGEIIQDGSPQEIKNQPATDFVQELISFDISI